jgi:hypothetical protein
MISREDLKELGFNCFNKDTSLFYDGLFDYMFDIKTQMLHHHCEVDGKIEPIKTIYNINEFKDTLLLT